MKACSVCVLLVVVCTAARGQTFDEWFKQKATQKKYLVQQIAALQVYIEYLEKGYRVADQGLTTIGDIKHGHFSLDTAFFNSLEQVSPAVQKYGKVPVILSLEADIVFLYKSTLQQATNSSQYTGKELGYINAVFGALIDACTTTTDELTALTSDYVIKLSDAERIQRIDNLYAEMLDRYSFATSFKNECSILTLQRIKEKADIDKVRELRGIR